MGGLTFEQRALAFGRDVYSGHGKIEILPKVAARSLEDMAVAYTPGVGHVVKHLLAHPEDLPRQTAKGNMIALVTDGSAVMGFGDVGPHAGIPVMEGKAVMFKVLAGIDCMPLCLKVQSPEEFCDVVAALEPSFGGINIEDVAAPHCFQILETLERRLSIPVIHDDQYGTATVVTAALLNALAVTGRRIEDTRVVINGLGAAGTAALEMIMALGAGDVIGVDRQGILSRRGPRPALAHWARIAACTNREDRTGNLREAMRGADVFIGLSVSNLVDEEMVRSMAPNPVVFGLANPEPEIRPDLAAAGGAAVTASGRFDFPNHCNNVLAFPGLMRGAIDTQARSVTLGMRLAAARALAGLIPTDKLTPLNILPSPLDLAVHATVAQATATEAIKEGVAQCVTPPGGVFQNLLALAKKVGERQSNLAGL